LSLEGGAADPWSGTRAWVLRNNGQAEQRLMQSLETPPGMYCAMSVYLRSSTAQTVRLIRGSLTSECATSNEWRRFQLSGQEDAARETTSFGIGVPAGATVEAFGFQVEAQLASSGYKRTEAQGGVYANARFRDDSLKFTCTDLGRYNCTMRIIHANHF
jgi:hypothetical protein